ncbi:ribosomal protein RPL4A, putative [Babesia bigemina]|uniref:Ribosomal protein RPL4A, putative n=1 Tax=Babesia bigemina TaxID=5866 RepID=A0A061D546_BABBI|nr:ribosomal protein RPL4A, putative [Babesia bigemina]CDR94094.1 ribosomal protein RPL4A, putative [Babesia bigemina]|eukprot:XP_012766280.1 ribosomal protein RPL4A, putative [Babesia bigemina]
MTLRPEVSVYNVSDGRRSAATVMPKVFSAPLRLDLVRSVHTNMSKNKRQAYAVSKMSGYQTSARSWGTGRAMARVPRVKGGGTHRAGQAAYANFCKAGGMYAPTRVWRRWHRKVNLKEKRQAIAAAIAATAVAPIVMSRGHRIEALREVPMVVDDSIEQLNKTKDAIKFLETVGLAAELERVSKIKGHARDGRKKRPVGPLIILRASAVEGRRAFRNIPGVEVASVERLNLLKLAPAGTLGRLCIWSKSAFEAVDEYVKLMPTRLLKNADMCALVNSTPVQRVFRAPRKSMRRVLIKRGCSTKVIKFVRESLRASGLADVKTKAAKTKEEIKRCKANSKAFINAIREAISTKSLSVSEEVQALQQQ